jgi:hypothetical protein
LNSIKSPAHPQGIEDNYTRIATFAKNCGAAFSTGLLLTRPKQFAEYNPGTRQNRGRM